MSFLSKYPPLKTIQAIAAKRRASVYLVGGFLRDHVLMRPQTDFDFAVDQNAILLAKKFAETVKGAFVLLDDQHGCGRVVKKIDGNPWTFDFADFRAKTLKEDIASRDFTFNTLCADLMAIRDCDSIDSHIIDLKGAGKDLKSKTIRMASKQAFKDDPLRLMRAYSLQAVLGFKIEKATLLNIKNETEKIQAVSIERVRDELFKILGSSNCFTTIRDMDRIGLLIQVMPQISVMYGVKQGGYHHLDVWKHSLEVLRQFEMIVDDMKNDPDITQYLHEDVASNHRRLSHIKLAALLHDIGKPETKKVEPQRTSFHGHEHVGKNITRLICKHLKLSVKERYLLENLVLLHLRPGYLSNFKIPTDKSVFRFFLDAKDEAVSVLLLSLADQRSTRGSLTTERDQMHHQKICLSLIRKYFQESKKVPLIRLIDGNDLIKKLKLKPSPLFATILKAVEEAQALGKVSNKQEALAFAAKLVK